MGFGSSDGLLTRELFGQREAWSPQVMRKFANVAVIASAAFWLFGCDGGGGGDGGGGTGNENNEHDAAAALCVDTINQYRDTLGLKAYARWTEQEECSNGEAKSDSETGTAHGAFGTCTESAQNECPGWPGPPDSMIPQCLDLMWAEGPGEDFSKHGHYINMSNPNYTKVACGFHVLADGSVWAVQNFQ